MIHRLQPAIMIVPLVDNDFNRAKSNIAWLEGCFAGAAVIAPDFPEFQRPGVLNYSSPEQFGDVLGNAMIGNYDLKKLSEDGWAHIRKYELLTHRNQIRVNALKDLLNREKETRDQKLPEWMSHKTF